jgi:hypothetical protein
MAHGNACLLPEKKGPHGEGLFGCRIFRLSVDAGRRGTGKAADRPDTTVFRESEVLEFCLSEVSQSFLVESEFVRLFIHGETPFDAR